VVRDARRGQGRLLAARARGLALRGERRIALLERGLGDLARARERQRVEELDPRRHLEVREERRAVPPEVVGRDRAVGDDDGLDALAQGAVGEAVDRRVGHARVVVERALDLDAVDVLRADEDHVLGAVRDRQVAPAVDRREVARAEPGPREGVGRGAADVAGEDRGAADPDLRGNRPPVRGVPTKPQTSLSRSNRRQFG